MQGLKENISVTPAIPDLAVSISQSKERILLLQQFVKEIMVVGVDYGYISNCQKPTLLKPGAEKLTDIYGLSKQIEVVRRVENWEKGLFAYEVKATLISKNTGLIEAQGMGSCNSREKKYKDTDGFSICNTILKIANKRALVDAVLSATRSSGLFSQDLEDIGSFFSAQESYNSYGANVKANQEGRRAHKEKLLEIFQLVEQKRIPISEIKSTMLDRYNVKESKTLTCDQADDFIKYLRKCKTRRKRKAASANA